MQTLNSDVQHMTADARQDFEGHAVSLKVNNAHNDDSSLIEPLKKDGLLG